MFGPYSLHPGGGVNPPYSPTYPLEWEAEMRTVETIARVDGDYVAELLATTPFEQVNDRASFRFIDQPQHTLALHTNGLLDTLITVPVRYRGLVTTTHLFMYCTDTIGAVAGREIFGYTKKDAEMDFVERVDGSASGGVVRRGTRLITFGFTPDEDVEPVPLVDGEEVRGEVHVRRLPLPDGVGIAYADTVFRASGLEIAERMMGRIDLALFESEFDPIARFAPEPLTAHFSIAGAFGGGFAREERWIGERLVP
jgi:acetoacetate decarboxylase